MSLGSEASSKIKQAAKTRGMSFEKMYVEEEKCILGK